MEIGYELPSKFEGKYSVLTRRLIRELSKNSRISILELSKLLGVSRRTVREKLNKAESELGIKYTVEFNEKALDLTNSHLILVKFTKKPDWDDITKILSSSYIPQLAVAIKGTYDLLIYANAITSSEYVHWDKSVQVLLSKYGTSWHSSDVAHRQLGYFPLRNELIDRITYIDPGHKEMLKLLNQNSRMTFSDISKATHMHFNTVAYNFNKIMDAGYIKKFTLSMDLPKEITLMTFFSKYIITEGFEDDAAKTRKWYTTSGIEFPIISRYLLCAQLVGSHDFFVMGVFDDPKTAYKLQVDEFKKVMKRHSPQIRYGQIARVLIGRLPVRSIDAKNEYKVIKWTAEPV